VIAHAGLLALLTGREWRGVLVTGPSGAGKSDLALRLMGEGFSLVADDRTVLWTSEGRLFGRAPETLAGKVEARGLGILEGSARPFAEVRLAAELTSGGIERLPDPTTTALLGVEVPSVRLAPFEASAAAKLRRWLIALG
jgi:serine kinase of HPr protein (carbohydrate metabolism regulator)